MIVEYAQGNRNPGNDAAAKAFGLMMAQAAADHTNLSIEQTEATTCRSRPRATPA